MTDEETRLLAAGYISRVIKKAREAKGWSIYKLAYESGVNYAHIYRLEEGFLSVRIDTLHKLCKALGLEIKVPLPI